MAWGYGNLYSGQEALNLSVAFSATRPASAQENTIWVNTDKAVPKWTFSERAPEGPRMWQGWIKTGNPTKTSINILEENQIFLDLAGAYLYTGAEWKSAESYIYKNGSWLQLSREWNGELYISGDEFTEKTGGWIARGLPFASGYPAGTPSLQKEADRMVFNTTAGGSVLYTENRIDLTGYSRLIFEGRLLNNEGNDNWQVFRIWSAFGGNAEENIVRQAKGRNATSLTIDIGDLNGTYIVGISNYTGQIIVEKLYME